MRPKTSPVTSPPSRFFATGTLTHSLFCTAECGERSSAYVGTVVARPLGLPELSPCHPLLTPMSPSARLAAASVIRPPRFGTSCHLKPLACDMSVGLTRRNEATDQTLPSGLPRSI